MILSRGVRGTVLVQRRMRGDIYCCLEIELIWSIFLLLINVNINKAIEERRGWHFHTMRFSSESVTHPFSYLKSWREKKTEERKNEHVFHGKAAETELMVVWNGLFKMSYPTVMSCILMYFPLLFHTFLPHRQVLSWLNALIIGKRDRSPKNKKMSLCVFTLIQTILWWLCVRNRLKCKLSFTKKSLWCFLCLCHNILYLSYGKEQLEYSAKCVAVKKESWGLVLKNL